MTVTADVFSSQSASFLWTKGCVSLTMRGVDAQIDGHRRDALVGSCDPVGLGLDLLPDLIEVGELFALTVEKLSKLCKEPRRGIRKIFYLTFIQPGWTH